MLRSTKTSEGLLGTYYSFFLNNTDLKTFYLYQVVTPGLTKDCEVLMSLKKVGEKTRDQDSSTGISPFTRMTSDIDVLVPILKSYKKARESGSEFLQELTKPKPPIAEKKSYDSFYFRNQEETYEPAEFYPGPRGNDFPRYVMRDIITKSLIVNLRNTFRWMTYSFKPGAYVDILVNPKKFLVLQIVSTENNGLRLEPKWMFYNNDPAMTEPIKYDPERVYYPKETFSGEQRASLLNRAIKRVENKFVS